MLAATSRDCPAMVPQIPVWPAFRLRPRDRLQHNAHFSNHPHRGICREICQGLRSVNASNRAQPIFRLPTAKPIFESLNFFQFLLEFCSFVAERAPLYLPPNGDSDQQTIFKQTAHVEAAHRFGDTLEKRIRRNVSLSAGPDARKKLGASLRGPPTKRSECQRIRRPSTAMVELFRFCLARHQNPPKPWCSQSLP